MHSEKDGKVASLPFTCPLGLTRGVPLTDIVEDLPWYPIGIWSQFSFKAFAGPRIIEPTLKAWDLDE